MTVLEAAPYLRAAEAPVPNTRLVNLRPLVRLDEHSPTVLAAEAVVADFPNRGRVAWPRPATDPKPDSLWWHQLQPNPGFIAGLRGSSRWLVQDARGFAGPTGAIEVLDLRGAFAADDRALRRQLIQEGLALGWQPTRRVYLCLTTPGVWIGPVELT